MTRYFGQKETAEVAVAPQPAHPDLFGPSYLKIIPAGNRYLIDAGLWIGHADDKGDKPGRIFQFTFETDSAKALEVQGAGILMKYSRDIIEGYGVDPAAAVISGLIHTLAGRTIASSLTMDEIKAFK